MSGKYFLALKVQQNIVINWIKINNKSNLPSLVVFKRLLNQFEPHDYNFLSVGNGNSRRTRGAQGAK